MKTKIIIIFLAICLAACGADQNEGQTTAQDKKYRPAPQVSLLQALRCEKIAEYATEFPQFVAGTNTQDVSRVLVRARNAALAEANKIEISVTDLSSEKNLISFGFSTMPQLSIPTESEAAQAKAKRIQTANRVAPELAIEFSDICVPLFL